MTVYIEYVLINNFVIDFLILKTVNLIRGKKVKNINVIFGACLGAMVSLVYPSINDGVISILLKIALALALVLICTDVKSLKDFYLGLVIFLLVTFFYLGVTIGILSLFNIDYQNEIFIAISSIPIYFFSKGAVNFYNFLKTRIRVKGYLYECKLIFKDKTVSAVGFLDTGNGLYYLDQPVVIIDKKIFSRLVKNYFPKIFYISYTGVGEEKIMPAFKIDKLMIYQGDQENIIDSVTIGVARVGLDYDVILHPSLLGGEYVKTFVGQTKKVG